MRGLVNGFGDKIIHDHIDLDVYRGEVLGVVGGSGAGKSVLLRSIIGLNTRKEGTIKVFGKEISDADNTSMRALEMRWGVLFQEGALSVRRPWRRTSRCHCANTPPCRRN